MPPIKSTSMFNCDKFHMANDDENVDAHGIPIFHFPKNTGKLVKPMRPVEAWVFFLRLNANHIAPLSVMHQLVLSACYN